MSTGNDVRRSDGVAIPSTYAEAGRTIRPMRQAFSDTPSPRRAGPAAALPQGTIAYLLGLGFVLLLALALAPIDGLVGPPVAVALALYAVIAAFVLYGIRDQALRRFGAANGVTLLRAAAVAFIAAIAALTQPFSASLRGTVVALGIVLLLLDGVDGWLARRGGMASRFGARFDMEVDALTVLVFTFLLLQTGQAGAWVLAIGLARYIFVGVGWLWPPLARELSQSLRRKTICVVVVAALLIALAPSVDRGPAAMVCAAALVLLTYSFAVDCVWLLILWRKTPPRHRPRFGRDIGSCRVNTGPPRR
jgi:phosphatidylglycerophosphate synthase